MSVFLFRSGLAFLAWGAHGLEGINFTVRTRHFNPGYPVE